MTFVRAWTSLLSEVADLPESSFSRPSGCAGWLVRDLVCHLVIDTQDVLITLVTPSEKEPTHGVAPPHAESLRQARDLLERVTGSPFPATFTDTETLLIATGRRRPTTEQLGELGNLAERLPIVLG